MIQESGNIEEVQAKASKSRLSLVYLELKRSGGESSGFLHVLCRLPRSRRPNSFIRDGTPIYITGILSSGPERRVWLVLRVPYTRE